MNKPTCRAKRKNSDEWINGYYAYKKLMDKHYILREETVPYSRDTVFEEIEVNPNTLEILETTTNEPNLRDLVKLTKNVFCSESNNKQLLTYEYTWFGKLVNNPIYMYWIGVVAGWVSMALGIYILFN